MPLPVGTIVEVSFRMRMYAQKMLNVFHYRVTGTSTIGNPLAEQADILSAVKAGGLTSMYGLHRACVPETVFYDEIRVQAIKPVRYAVTVSPEVQQGLLQPSNVTNLSAVITKRTDLSGRQFVGSVHIPAGDPDTIVQGQTTAAFDLLLTNFATKMVANLTGPTGGGVYVPVIFHRPPLTTEATTITGFNTQDTIRVMRRRTVGLGE